MEFCFVKNKFYINCLWKFDGKDYQFAIDDFSHPIQINPHNEDTFNWRGNIKLILLNQQDSLNDYTKVLEFHP